MEEDLFKLVDFLVDNPGFKLKISGHTDSDGNPESNLKLSQKRAESIKSFIEEKGHIDNTRVEAKGYGNQKPIVVEKTEADKKINRRVEFELIKPVKQSNTQNQPESE
jgi:outer membrane protein OmpA-like peptidoglycan-associated protein